MMDVIIAEAKITHLKQIGNINIIVHIRNFLNRASNINIYEKSF